MIDKLFGAIEDIYFTLNTDSTEESTKNALNLDANASGKLEEVILEFKEIAMQTMYVGRSGNQFRLLKLAALFLNHVMYEDDGVFSPIEQELLDTYIRTKLSRLDESEKEELYVLINKRIELIDILTFIQEEEISLRAIDMILDKIIHHLNNQEQYNIPLEHIFVSLIGL